MRPGTALIYTLNLGVRRRPSYIYVLHIGSWWPMAFDSWNEAMQECTWRFKVMRKYGFTRSA